jgi:hypothetical protein
VIQPPKHPAGSHIDISELAKELEQQEAHVTTDAQKPAEPVKPVEPAEPTELPVPKFQKPTTPPGPAEDDTIIIDQDGNLVYRDETADKPDSKS